MTANLKYLMLEYGYHYSNRKVQEFPLTWPRLPNIFSESTLSELQTSSLEASLLDNSVAIKFGDLAEGLWIIYTLTNRNLIV